MNTIMLFSMVVLRPWISYFCQSKTLNWVRKNIGFLENSKTFSKN